MADVCPSFFPIVKSLLRPEGATEVTVASVSKSCTWLVDQIGQFARYSYTDEAKLLGIIVDHWNDHSKPPSATLVKEIVFSKKDPNLTSVFDDYEAAEGDLKRHEPQDLPGLFALKVSEFRNAKTAYLLQQAATIARDHAEVPAPNGRGPKVVYKGADDAIRYVGEKLDAGIIDGPKLVVTGGLFRDLIVDMVDDYDKMKAGDAAGDIFATGMERLDQVISPMRGQLFGIKGYAKSGKTRFGRTWMYRLLCHGHNVCHLTYEQSTQEEVRAYACIHSHNRTFFDKEDGLSVRDCKRGTLSRKQELFLKEKLVPDILGNGNLPGQLIIQQPTGKGGWEDLLTQVVRAHRKAPLDALFIDMIACMHVSSYGEKEAYNEIIKEAKQLAQNFDDRGLLVVSPFHVNREEWVKAGKNNGRYEANACYMYSQVEKSVDAAYYVYSDDALAKDSCAILGASIHRNGPNVDPFRVAVEQSCGTYHNFRGAITEDSLDHGILDEL